jgi:glucose 1-dehydrogenase
MIRLNGQIALVTGASSGIGKATALALGAAGADVVVNYIGGDDEAEAVVEAIRAHGQRAIHIMADVSDEAQVEAMFKQAIDELGAIDLLVNNAGIQRDSNLIDMTLDQWNQVMSVNLTGQFLCSRAAVRHFLDRGPRPEVSKARGSIVCMSSVHQQIPWAGHANYAASKGGIMLFMQTLAQELAPQGIRVNGIAPGAIKTNINRDSWYDAAALESLLRLVPQNRIGVPDDVARAVVWLASDYSDYCQGITLFVDGGMALYPGFAAGG